MKLKIAAALMAASLGFADRALADITYLGQVVGSGAYRPTGSHGGFERLYVIRGTDPNGAIVGATCCSGVFNDPATFPGFALASGAQPLTLLSTGVYGSSFVSDIYFGDGATVLALAVPETPVGSTAPAVSGTLGGYTITVSGFTWGASDPYLDRVGFCCSFGGDGQDNVGHLTITLTPIELPDTEKPVVSVETGVAKLWPPNHDLADVGLAITVSDNKDPNPTTSISIWSDELEDASTGDGTHAPDAKDIAAATLRLRSERNGGGDGRVYLIIVTATDASGNTTISGDVVCVPKSSSKGDQTSVNAQAGAALNTLLTTGLPPADFYQIGMSPAIGPKQ